MGCGADPSAELEQVGPRFRREADLRRVRTHDELAIEGAHRLTRGALRGEIHVTHLSVPRLHDVVAAECAVLTTNIPVGLDRPRWAAGSAGGAQRGAGRARGAGAGGRDR